MKTLRQLLVLGLMVATTGSFAFAQTFTGGVRGAVKDANGVIPGVTVVLFNEATGQAREAVSNDAGEYNFTAVPPGLYTVRATLTGFKTYENKGIRIAAQQFVTVDVVPRSRRRCRRRSPSPARRRSSTRRTPPAAASSAPSRWRPCRAAAARRSCSP